LLWTLFVAAVAIFLAAGWEVAAGNATWSRAIVAAVAGAMAVGILLLHMFWG
jgi:hypothetical protein